MSKFGKRRSRKIMFEEIDVLKFQVEQLEKSVGRLRDRLIVLEKNPEEG